VKCPSVSPAIAKRKAVKMRYTPKGGLWKNSEDEVLKAAIQKYGQQNWARVASLLNQKTAKQAKARWYEYLDPSIKKTSEWSREEDEKLLSLAKFMPAQWKTIAPLVGNRTAVQCQERYEELLDAHTSSDTKRTPVDDNFPETKPARPDAIDMDEEELEMLQEARARLANTVGKKAKRKQREKMLAAAKRMADLQKRRELKQAGLSVRSRTRRSKQGIDLGREIPFFKPVPAGFHDTTAEQEQSAARLEGRKRKVNLKKVNENAYRTRDREEARFKKREATRMRLLEETNEKNVEQAKQDGRIAEDQRPRSELQLPAPTSARQDKLVSSLPSLKGGPTNALVSDASYRTGTPSAAQPAPFRDLAAEAAELRQLERGQTPLLTTEGASDVPADATVDDDAASVGASTLASTLSIREMARQERRAIKKARAELAAALAALPAAEYEYELGVVPETVDEEEEKGVENVPDQMEVEEAERLVKRRKLEEELKSRSTVVQRNLPRPFALPDFGESDDAIQQEVVRMLRHDAYAHAVVPDDSKKKKKKRKEAPVVAKPAPLEEMDKRDLERARESVQQEFEALMSEKIALVIQDGKASNEEQAMAFLVEATMASRPELMFTGSKWSEERNKKDEAKVKKQELEILTTKLSAMKERNDKKEKKRQLLTGGYIQRSETLQQEVAQEFADVQNLRIEQAVFGSLERDHEVPGAARRIERLKNEIGKLKQIETSLQKQYSDMRIEQRRRAIQK